MKEDAHEKLRDYRRVQSFHNGHRYHVEMARKITGAEVVIAVMSGNFCKEANRLSSINGIARMKLYKMVWI